MFSVVSSKVGVLFAAAYSTFRDDLAQPVHIVPPHISFHQLIDHS